MWNSTGPTPACRPFHASRGVEDGFALDCTAAVSRVCGYRPKCRSRSNFVGCGCFLQMSPSAALSVHRGCPLELDYVRRETFASRGCCCPIEVDARRRETRCPRGRASSPDRDELTNTWTEPRAEDKASASIRSIDATRWLARTLETSDVSAPRRSPCPGSPAARRKQAARRSDPFMHSTFVNPADHKEVRR
jgi:hypothetical protein